MGASLSSTNHPSPESQEQHQQESIAAATATSLSTLRAAFSRISDSSASLQDALTLPPSIFQSDSLRVPPHFLELLTHLGPSIASLFFATAVGGGGGIDWVEFLKGYNRCCMRMPMSQSLTLLFRVYAAACADSGVSCRLVFGPDEAGDDVGGKVGGDLNAGELTMFLWMCWVMARSSRVPVWLEGREKDAVVLPDVTHLVLSALVSSGVVPDDESVWKRDVLGVEKSIPVQKIQSWMLTTAVGLGLSLSWYVQGRIKSCAASEENMETSDSTSSNAADNPDLFLLTHGRAWAISLTLRNTISEKLLGASFIGMDTEDLLYRSSVHGKGLSRFWSHVQGYDGPILILLSAYSASGSDNDASNRKWMIGVLTEQGFENKHTFYGSSGFLYAIHPIFRMLPPSGKEKNFMYCHLHNTVRVYDPKPKPVGLAFGGSMGNERICLNEDFAKVTVRHHAVDKTYQHGSLIPNQGFLSVEAPILEVEAWGLGGERAREQQDAYMKRENLFSEQRRKVDLKNFSSWEDSPEKMMMDMVSDPNKVQREDR